MLNPLMVSSIGTITPFSPVNCSAAHAGEMYEKGTRVYIEITAKR